MRWRSLIPLIIILIYELNQSIIAQFLDIEHAMLIEYMLDLIQYLRINISILDGFDLIKFNHLLEDLLLQILYHQFFVWWLRNWRWRSWNLIMDVHCHWGVHWLEKAFIGIYGDITASWWCLSMMFVILKLGSQFLILICQSWVQVFQSIGIRNAFDLFVFSHLRFQSHVFIFCFFIKIDQLLIIFNFFQ